MSDEPAGEAAPPDGTWVVIPVHDRRDVTKACLDHLRETQAWESLNVVVVDDGSTDGTSDVVADRFPSVHLLSGDGSLWWGGAMRAGMEFARDRGAEVFVWLNDDVLPRPGVLGRLAAKTADLGDTVLGSMVYPTTGHEYSTRWFRAPLGMTSELYEPDREIQPCEILSGKLVAFPRDVVDAIGMPATGEFHHAYADFDYTYRATEVGFDVGVYRESVAMDTAYTFAHSGLSPEYSFVETLEATLDPSSDSSILMKFKRDRRFGTAPPAVLLGYNVLKGAGVIGLKLAYTVGRSDHRFA